MTSGAASRLSLSIAGCASLRALLGGLPGLKTMEVLCLIRNRHGDSYVKTYEAVPDVTVETLVVVLLEN